VRGARAVMLVVSAGRTMGGARRPVGAALVISGAVTLTAALVPELDFSDHLPAPHVALETAAPLIALLAAFLVFGRFLRSGRLTELALTCSLGALILSELAFITVPVLTEHDSPDLSVWAALAGRAFGAALFAVAAFVPCRRLRRPWPALAVSAVAVMTVLLLIAFLTVSFADHLPKVPVATPAQGLSVWPGLRADAVLLVSELIVAVIYGLTAVGFVRRAQRYRDEFFGWLAIAAVLAAAAHVNYFLYWSSLPQSISIGDIFRLCFYLVLLAGFAREIRFYWCALSDAEVLEERRRIARDLHDGLAQELAYLLRSLNSLDGTIDADIKARLRRAAEQAQLEARLTVNTLAASRGQSVNVAIAQAVGEIAARDHVRLELDVPPDIRLPAGRAEALVRIACEAVGNAVHHSGAGRVSLSLRRDGSRVRLRVSDSGSGFEPEAPVTGFGLISMRERASSVGGDLRISTVPGHGTEVEATL
jgi:signal transduction histidine kinase